MRCTYVRITARDLLIHIHSRLTKRPGARPPVIDERRRAQSRDGRDARRSHHDRAHHATQRPTTRAGFGALSSSRTTTRHPSSSCILGLDGTWTCDLSILWAARANPLLGISASRTRPRRISANEPHARPLRRAQHPAGSRRGPAPPPCPWPLERRDERRRAARPLPSG